MKPVLTPAMKDLRTSQRDMIEQERHRQLVIKAAQAAGDRCWLQQQSIWLRLAVKAARRPVNRFAKSLINTAHERSMIDAEMQHALAGMVDRMLWPERY